MSQPQVCTVDGGLINPALLPAKAADLDTSTITGAADDLRTMGSTVDTKTDEIKSTWGGLSGCYEAPEQAQVYALMNDPATASEDVKTTFATMAGHLDTYADALDKIKPKLADFEKRAQEFRDEVIDGVWVDATEASDAHLGTYIKAGWNGLTGQDQDRKKVPWYEDGDTVEKNQNFVKEIGGIYADVSAAAATCATSINGLTSLPADSKKVEGIPEEAFYNPESPMPWGSPREEDRNCPESVGHGAYQFGKNTIEGLGQLISYNPETGKWGDWGHAGQTWMGTGNVLLSLAVTGVGTVGFTQLMKATGNGDNPVVQWLDERHKVSATVVSGLVGIDLNAKDPFHKWKEDGVATFTESFLNVGTMFIPGAGQAGAAVKVAGLGSKLARVTGAVADFAVPGGSWLVKGGLHTIPVLKNVIRFADEVPVNLIDDAAKVGGKTPTFNPGALIDDVTDVPAPKVPDKPVSASSFGDGPGPGSLDGGPRTTTTHPHAPTVDTPAVKPDAPEPHGSSAKPEPEPTKPEPEPTKPEPEPTKPEPEPTKPEPEPTKPVDPRDPDADPTSNPHPDADPQHGVDPDGGQPDNAGQPDHHPATDDGVPTEHGTGDHGTTDHGNTDPHAHDAPDGGPTQDRHGRGDYTFDSEGRRHLPGDPENTYRDINGKLHDAETGRFTADTNRPDTDLPVEHAEKGDSHNADLPDEAQAAHDQRLQERTDAETAAHDARATTDELAAEAGIDPELLQGSSADVSENLRDLVAEGEISPATAGRLGDAAAAQRTAMQAFKDASERLGDEAASAVSQSIGETPLLNTPGMGAGRFDNVALGDNPPHLTFYESKGGNSPLGYRNVDGVRAQQGTTSYLNAIADVDPRFAAELRRFVDANPNSPVVRAIKDGTVEIRYTMVQALPSGRIKVTPFVLDRSALKIPGVGG